MIKAYEENGRFFFDDGWKKIETTELIDCDLVVHDDYMGYIYKSRSLFDYEKDRF